MEKSSRTVSDNNASANKSFTDTAGRTLTIPANVKKVYSLNPIGNIMMYTLAPDKIAGLSSKVAEDDKKFLTQSYNELPVLSGIFGQGNTMNTEEILKVKPDVIINMGNVDHTTVDGAQKIQEQLGIPVAVIRFDLKTMGKSYEMLGELIGDKARAKELGDYCTKVVNEIGEVTAKIPEEKRVRVYYAEGEKGLETDPKGSPHSEVLDLVGGINVADVAVQKGYGRSLVSIEQLLKWNPDRIIVCIDNGTPSEKNPYHYIMNDSTMKNLDAVKNKKIYAIPYHPFSWFDRPASVNRIIGVKWLANLLYPDMFNYDIRKETKEFYQKFYYRKLTDEEVDEIIACK
ncbi:MAG: High-affinity heme uptake system protein IsdE precursor [Firmicutes bacterium ADurb.Bin419]|nr:MAG: High-affinity heme uptake system protein IsdE precursor [Firmicutes bacterium ADurb.Bin419]